MKLSSNFKVEAIEYASQGNAVLGIRDSGKTYTATAIAEKLMDEGIPIIAFDPIGVWRNLKIGANGKKGYPIVVAGENADLELTVESAPQIVRAAMKGNISLVLDLYSMKLSKADWKRIVQSCIQLLLYENKPCGLRHIFLEEAAEFCPQRVGPESGRVYAEIEKLARMGGNASLGYTLINQRAEEVNKAVLELCDCLFLHRQKGRHSLTALGKWLDVADAEDSRGVVKSLPMLKQGECWIWQQGSQKPVRVEVLPKRTVHPDRRNPLAALKNATKGLAPDVSKFVAQMRESLEEISKKAVKKDPTVFYDTETLGQWKEIVTKGNQMVNPPPCDKCELLQVKLTHAENKANALEKIVESLKKSLKPKYELYKSMFEKMGEVPTQDNAQWTVWLDKLQGKNREMLEVLIEAKSLTRQQLAFRVGVSAKSSTYANYLSKLKTLGLTVKNGDQISLRQ